MNGNVDLSTGYFVMRNGKWYSCILLGEDFVLKIFLPGSKIERPSLLLLNHIYSEQPITYVLQPYCFSLKGVSLSFLENKADDEFGYIHVILVIFLNFTFFFYYLFFLFYSPDYSLKINYQLFTPSRLCTTTTAVSKLEFFVNGNSLFFHIKSDCGWHLISNKDPLFLALLRYWNGSKHDWLWEEIQHILPLFLMRNLSFGWTNFPCLSREKRQLFLICLTNSFVNLLVV